MADIDPSEIYEPLHPLNDQLTGLLYDPLNRGTEIQRSEFAHAVFPSEIWLGHTALAVELSREAYLSLPISKERLAKRAESIGAEAIVQASLQELDQQTETQLDAAWEATENVDPELRIIAIAEYFGEQAYAGKKRLTNEEYMTHPVRAAAMGLHIMEKIEDTYGAEIDKDIKDVIMLLSILHDATEETMRGSKHFDPEREGHFTPLLVYRTLERLENPYAREAADALWLMTHLKRREWMSSYDEYVDRGSTNIFFCVVKVLDQYDNSTMEPKPMPPADDPTLPEKQAKWMNKLRHYKDSMPQLQESAAWLANKRDDTDKWYWWVDDWFETLRRIDKEDAPALVARYEDVKSQEIEAAA